jgi:serine/threonine protein phosphatase PrpC
MRRALIKKALAESFPDIHSSISAQWFDTQLSGATLTACLVTDDGMLYTANVGDSHALLLTYD